MSLAIGTVLGTYKITELIGRGGMGTVYRALDTKLNRTVAIKILSTEVADATARRRFQQEAQTASSLNHPHILVVHDVGETDGRQYLVTEFVDGGTLREWTQSARRSPKQVVELLTGVADALACAHDAGILHRDVKPENILLAKNGYAKLADFGLAKLEQAERADTVTLAAPATRTGAIVGTLAYMSPEQASGEPVDARSDIYSFGIVLYESLTGRRFWVRGAIPDVTTSTSDLPPPLRLALEKSLEPDPGDRYQSMRELVVDLRRYLRAKPAPAVATKRRRRAAWLPWIAAGALFAILVAREAWRTAAAPENPLDGARFTRLTDTRGDELSASISPDGKFVAFVSDRDGPHDVWLTQPGTGQFLNLTRGTVPGLSAAYRAVGFGSDGSEVWFASGELEVRVHVMPLTGGTPRNFLTEKAANVAWSPDGGRLAYHTYQKGDPLFVADRNGANARKILEAAPGVHNHFPIWSPDGRWIYYVHGTPNTREMDMWRVAADGGAPQRLTNMNSDVAFPTPVSTDVVLFIARDADGSGPWLRALDVRRKTSRRVALGLEQYTSVAASAQGDKLAATISNPEARLWSIPILDRPAEERDAKPYPLPTVRALAPRFAGGTLFYLSSRGAGDGLWRYRNGQSEEIWKGAEGPLLEPAAVSPDGARVAIVLRKQGRRRLHVLSADGGDLQSLSERIDVQASPCWSPDGRWIAIGGDDGTGSGLFKIPVDGGAAVRLTHGDALDPVWSPAGDAIVFAGANVGAYAPLLCVRPDGAPAPFPQIGVRRGGERVRFSPDGKRLVYMQGLGPQQDFWELDLATMRTRRLSSLTGSGHMRTFDVTPDGKQIVFDRLRDNADVVLIEIPKR